MDFPAVTVCNRNRVHCGHLKQMIAANLSETRNLSIAEAYFLLEKGEYSEEDNFAEMFSLLEDTGCRNDFDKYNDTVLLEGSFGLCRIVSFLHKTGLSVCSLVNHGSN